MFEHLFDWFSHIMDGFFDFIFEDELVPMTKPKRKKTKFKCCDCGQVYKDPDKAALCGDWDKILKKNSKK